MAILFAVAIMLIFPGCTGQQNNGNDAGQAATNNAPSLPDKTSNASHIPGKTTANNASSLQDNLGNAGKTEGVSNTPNQPAVPSGRIDEYGNYLLFVPDRKNLQNDSIFIVAFSPSGDARSMVDAWKSAAEKRGWPIFASKTYHNGELPQTFNNDTFSDIGNASLELGYAKPKLVFTGFSGGGQVSHAFAFGSPSKVAAVVTNCGIINRGFLNFTSYYPHNKTVLFIASLTDFRYEDMKQDKIYLEALGWKTGWIEFSGGHMLAPPDTYEQAAEWLEDNVGNASNKTRG
jgi:hypothetical protein